MEKSKNRADKLLISVLIVVVGLVLFNQWQINSISNAIVSRASTRTTTELGVKDLSNVDLSSIEGTGYAIAALFPVENIQTTQDAVNIIIPTGTPDYGSELGISFDNPSESLSTLALQVYPAILGEIKKDSVSYQRYLNIVLKPVGISCEFCCGLQGIGASSDGSATCGCKHNPALLGLTMWLIKNTDYSDAEIVREALKWKSLWYPKNMVELALTVAGGDTSKLENLPGMVGGC